MATDLVARRRNGRPYIPLRFVARARHQEGIRPAAKVSEAIVASEPIVEKTNSRVELRQLQPLTWSAPPGSTAATL
ncbi:MAG: hypothetical protein ACRDYA_20025 [Egibacteraceae bacterium]